MTEKIAFYFPSNDGDGTVKIKPAKGMPSGGEVTVNDLIQWGVTVLLVAATLLCLTYLILGGIQWITSGGDKHGVETARNKIVYALIGLIVTFLSFAIINLIGKIIGTPLINF